MVEEENVWVFPGAENGPTKGLNDSGVETFNGNKIGSLAREICQNSLDAKHPRGTDGGEPVTVEFKLFDTHRDEFPGLAAFRAKLSAMRTFWKKKENDQALGFLDKVDAALARPRLRWLRISDFHTTGLTGVSSSDPDEGNAWLNLVKSSGVSQKTDSSGGSFGIGKFAAFSCSQLRTVFYATRTINGEEGFQGVAHLMSFREGRSLAFGSGYCGRAGALQSLVWRSPDPSFMRDRPGTDIFIPALLGRNFKEEIVEAVLDGFLYAIWKNRLVVKISDGSSTDQIDSAWLERAEAEHAFPTDHLAFKYDAMKTPENQWHKRAFGSGTVRLCLVAGPGRKSRIAMIRDPGMQIFQKGYSGSALSFTGVLVVEGDLNRELKEFENPQHTEWAIKRNPDKGDLLRDIYAFCEEKLKELVKVLPGEEIDSGLSDILPDESEEGEKRENEKLTVKIRSLATPTPKRSRRKRPKHGKGGTPTGKKGGRKGGGGAGGHGAGKGDPGGGGGSSDVVRYEVDSVSFRSRCRDRAHGAYTLKIVPAESAPHGFVDVRVIAEIKEYPARVLGASLPDGSPLPVDGSVVGGFAFVKGQPLLLDVTLDSNDYLSLEVDCHGHD